MKNSIKLLLLTKSPNPIQLILDMLSGAAIASIAAIYSLRLIRAAYAGFCIRVRRSSDNAEQNIGFVGGVLDTVALLAFVGAGNGFVVTWHDQSGNARDITQATAALQPRIVNAGVVDIVNTKPTVAFIAGSILAASSNFGLGGNPEFTVTTVFKVDSIPGTKAAFGWGNVGNARQACGLLATNAGNGNYFLQYAGSTNANFQASGTDLNVVSTLKTAGAINTTSSLFKNGVAQTIQTSSSSIPEIAANPFVLGQWANGGADLMGSISEIEVFASALSTADRQLLEANQKAYYGTP